MSSLRTSLACPQVPIVSVLMSRRHKDSTISSTCLASEKDELPRECDVCDEETTRKCSICGKGSFCSDWCQRKRSVTHLFTCSGHQLTSADYLWQSLIQDLMPEEDDVLEDFGFNNFLLESDKTKLLGLYRGLFLSGEFSAEDLHKWRVGGILINKIKKFFFGIREEFRGQYFPWFLKNCNVLECPIPQDEVPQRLVASFDRKARPFLDD